MQHTKRQWTELEIERMVAMAEEKPYKPGLLAAFDHVTDGQVSARLTNAGGKREGAGRPPRSGEENATERIFYTLTPTEAAKLDEQTLLGETRNQTARRLLLGLLARY